jgi:4,5-DOPA dioxygenase extradiol
MDTKEKMPTLFVSHGPPFVAVKNCPSHRFFKGLGEGLPRPRAVLSISAHWESVAPLLTDGDTPGILYDFGGPPALRSLQYDINGDPGLVNEIIDLLELHGISVQSQVRGFDHGTWIPLMLMYPHGKIPVVQISIQTEENPEHHYRMGRALAPLREAGVLMMASGGAVHNLDEAQAHGADDPPPDHVRQFEKWLTAQITGGHTSALLDYQRQAPHALRCHPYPAEHFLPLFVALGAAEGRRGRKLHGSYLLGTLSMATYVWEQ